VLTAGESSPAPAVSGGKPPAPTAVPAQADLQETVASPPEAQQVLVNYQVAENGHKVYFQLIDEKTGQVLLQVPPAAVLSSEEKLYDDLQKRAKPPQE
jgi:hypothetical protein